MKEKKKKKLNLLSWVLNYSDKFMNWVLIGKKKGKNQYKIFA